jgi:transcription elongation GreA/GreB family factor
MIKKQILEKLIEDLRAKAQLLESAARTAHEGATHEESKAEDKYDTRGLEASYLAGAQAKRAYELQQLIESYEFLPLRDFDAKSAIDVTALVTLRGEKSIQKFFLVPKGGGLSVEISGQKIQIITPVSLIGEELVGRSLGESFEVEIAGELRDFEIAAVE